MAESNEAFYGLAHDDELVDVRDQYERLPERGANAALDAFVERKHIDIDALVKLGARMADYTVLAFAYPGGIKFRDIVTDKRWNYVGSEFTRMGFVHAGLERAPIAIVAEGETDAARLTMLYPEADIAILPAGANPGRHVQAYAAQLAPYELVLLAHDYGVKGDEGAAMLAEHLATRSLRWLAPIEPADNEGWGDVPVGLDVPILPDPSEIPEPNAVGSLVFTDLRALLNGDLQPPDVMVDDLLYVEGVHWISGHPGCGKTTLVMNAAWEAMATGRHVVWLDYEGGDRATVRRLREVGVPVDLILERFHYAGWPEDAAASLSAIAERWPFALVVIDSASKALQMAGLDENSPSEVTKWMAPVVKECKRHALPVVVIDHVTKDSTSKQRYARGAGSKLADSDVAWYVELHEPFSRTQAGVIHCVLKKDRDGVLPPAGAWYTVGDGQGSLAVLPTAAPAEDQPPTPGSDEPLI